ncbi:unnamed protein product [Choristocarpus tenellus]
MHPLVRDLLKRFVIVSRHHPGGECWVKERVKKGLQPYSKLQDEVDIKRAVAKGRRAAREAAAFSSFARYRILRNRYGKNSRCSVKVAEDQEIVKGVGRDNRE